MSNVERLRLRTVRRGRSPIRSRANRLGGGRMHGVKPSSVHTLDENHVTPGIDDHHRQRDARLLAERRRSGHDLFRTGERKTLAVGNVHGFHCS